MLSYNSKDLDKDIKLENTKTIYPEALTMRSNHTMSHKATTNTRLTALCPGLPGWASTRKVKPIWILLKQETVSGNAISWAMCKSASRSRQITTTAPHHSVFTGRMPFLPSNQQCQSTEGSIMTSMLLQLITKTVTAASWLNRQQKQSCNSRVSVKDREILTVPQ